MDIRDQYEVRMSASVAQRIARISLIFVFMCESTASGFLLIYFGPAIILHLIVFVLFQLLWIYLIWDTLMALLGWYWYYFIKIYSNLMIWVSGLSED